MSMDEGAVVATLPQEHGFNLSMEPWRQVLNRTVEAAVVCCADGAFGLEQRKELRKLLGVDYYHQVSFAGAPHCFTSQAVDDGLDWSQGLAERLERNRATIFESLDLLVSAGVRQIALVSHEKCKFVLKVFHQQWPKFSQEQMWHNANRQHGLSLLKTRYPHVRIYSSFAQADPEQPGFVRIKDWVEAK